MFNTNQRGSAIAEYSIVVALISITAIFSIYQFGSTTSATYGEITESIHTDENGTGAEDSGGSELPGGEDVGAEDPEEFVDEGTPEIDYYYPDLLIGRYDERVRVRSTYEDVPHENYGDWVNFAIWSDDGAGSPMAIVHTESGVPASSGRVQFGTQIEADIIEPGTEQIIYVNFNGTIAGWRIAREGIPAVEAFSFPDTIVAWDDSRTRVESSFVDIQGLDHMAREFTLVSSDGAGNPLAVSNVEGGVAAASGNLSEGTMLAADIPAAGEQRIMTLTVDGVSGQWRVARNAAPAGPAFALTGDNGSSWAQINFATLGLPQVPYSFSISGTGGTDPRLGNFSSGHARAGMTDAWGLNIYYNQPPTGVTETVTLIIDGQTVTWTAYGY